MSSASLRKGKGRDAYGAVAELIEVDAGREGEIRCPTAMLLGSLCILPPRCC
jgi:hypothetical protein